MISQPRAQLQDIAEYLCKQGCTQVREYIKQLNENNPPPELANFSKQEQEWVKRELSSIMAIYDEPCNNTKP